MRKAPWQISHREVLQIKHFLEENEAQLLHIYFGHIAVHLLPLILHWLTADRGFVPWGGRAG